MCLGSVVCELLHVAVVRLDPELLPGRDGDEQSLVSSGAICLLCTSGRELRDASLPSWVQAWAQAGKEPALPQHV